MEVCSPYQKAHSFHTRSLRLCITVVNMNCYGYHNFLAALLAPTSQIRVPAALSLLTAGNQKLRIGSGLQWYHIHIKFDQNPSCV
jgi:hypothetical protein